MIPPIPFARAAYVAVSATEIFYANGDRYEFTVYSRDGALLRTVRAAAAPVPVPRDEVERTLDRYREMATNAAARASLQRQLDAVKLPTTMPAFGGMEVEPDGTVWLRNYAYDKDTIPDPVLWARFDPAGRLVGMLETPAGHRVVRFTREHVILTRYDPDTEATTLFVHRVERITR